MRLVKRAVTGALTTALAVGLLSVPAATADASTHKVSKSSHGVSVSVKVKDLTNKKGKYTVKDWAVVTVKVPGKFQDHYSDGTNYGSPEPVNYSLVVTTTGDQTCGGKTGTTVYYKYGLTASKTFTVPITFDNRVKSAVKHYTLSGKCKLTAEVDAYRYTIDAAGNVDTDFKTATTFSVRTQSHATTPSASATKVKKNKSVKLSGKVTVKKADSKHYYTSATVAKGTKLTLQAKAKGSSTWKKVATVKVGSGGRWSKTVKVTKTTAYRVVYAGARKVNPDTSGSRTIKVG